MTLAPVALIASLAAPCKPTVFPVAGRYRAARLTGGPGLVLSGGGLSGMPYVRVLRWMREHIAAPPNARAGNLLVLQESGDRAYYTSRFYATSKFASITEILIPHCASRAQIDSVASYVTRADAVLFAGGDQAYYVPWKGSKLIAAVRQLYARGGIVGGGSAGLAIQGQVVFDSVADDRIRPNEDVATPDAVRDPYEPAISFTTGFFNWPPLRGCITDTHFARRDRFGRLAAFMARALRDGLLSGSESCGVAVDEGAALLVNGEGIATLVEHSRESDGYVPRGAYIVQGARAARIAPGEPLLYTVEVTHLNEQGSRYDVIRKRGGGLRYRVTVDGAKSPPYSRVPYR